MSNLLNIKTAQEAAHTGAYVLRNLPSGASGAQNRFNFSDVVISYLKPPELILIPSPRV